MSYLRPLSLQPSSLKSCALDSWLNHLLCLIRDCQIISRGKPVISPSIESMEECLKVIVPFDRQGYDATYFPAIRHKADGGEPQVFYGRRPILLHSARLSRYLDSLLPISVQEEAFHRGAQLLRKAEILYNADVVFPIFFCLLWRHQFRHLDAPPVASPEDRVVVLDRMAATAAAAAADGSSATETARIRLFEPESSGGLVELSIEESYLTKRVLRGLRNLRVLSLWWACDDAMLNIVGSVCVSLEALDVWRSSAVTDLGIKMLLLSSDAASDSTPLCASLRRLGVKETSCTHLGCIAAVMRCPNLEVINFSHTSTVKDFFAEIRRLTLKGKVKTPGFSLKTLFLPVDDGTQFHEIIRAFPKLEDLRLWTAVSQFRTINADDLTHLHSLLLGGLHSDRILEDLVAVVGHQLTTLKIETVVTEVPLQVIGNHCHNLAELQVINGRLTVGRDHDCDTANESYFAKLKLVYLFLVQYINPHAPAVVNNDLRGRSRGPSDPSAPSALHCLLNHACSIEGVQANGCHAFSDTSLSDILSKNPMRRLRRFVVTDASVAAVADGASDGAVTAATAGQTPQDADQTSPGLALSCVSALRLLSSCPHLSCLGDFRHWDVTPAQRRTLAKKMQERTGVKWISTASH